MRKQGSLRSRTETKVAVRVRPSSVRPSERREVPSESPTEATIIGNNSMTRGEKQSGRRQREDGNHDSVAHLLADMYTGQSVLVD